MMKKKILFRIQNLGGGGAEKSLMILLNHLDYSKYEVDLLLNDKMGIYLSQVPQEVGLYHIGSGTKFLEKAWRKLKCEFYKWVPYFLYRFKLKNKKYDLEIGFLEGVIPYLANNYLKSKKIAWVHLDLRESAQGVYKKKLFQEIILSIKKVDEVVVVSESAKKALLSFCPELVEKIRVIYNPIDPEEVIKKSKEEEPPEKREGLRLISVGRLMWQKGFDRLIKVCHKLKSDGLKFELLILGEGPLKENLTRQIAELFLEGHVKLLGFKENPYSYILTADIFVMSSYVEGLPYVILEALVLNRPIVSTDITGSRELLKDGEWGLLVESSEEGLYEGLKKMISDNSFRESFVNKEKIFSTFETKKVIHQVENLLNGDISIYRNNE